MIALVKDFTSTIDTSEFLFEVFIELLKLGVRSGNSSWAESWGTAEQADIIISAIHKDNDDYYQNLREALNEFGFDFYLWSTRPKRWSIRQIRQGIMPRHLNSNIFPDHFKEFVSRFMYNTPARYNPNRTFTAQCKEIIDVLLIPSLTENSLSTKDLLTLERARKLMNSERCDIYEIYSIRRIIG